MRIIILTADLPFFPGKNGHDHFNLRHLAKNHDVAVVAPIYDWMPAAGIENLEKAVTNTYLWPRSVTAVSLFPSDLPRGFLAPWVRRLPRRARRWLLDRLLGIHRQPPDAFEKLAILSNCAPYLLQALQEKPCHAIVLIQSNTAPWLSFLPGGPAKLIYFHDVCSDYLRRGIPLPDQTRLDPCQLRSVRRQETNAAAQVDAVGFVSELDRERGKELKFKWKDSGVAPIPIDTEYYAARPFDRPQDPRPIVLFTGHLSHPPNVDTVLFFLERIWPKVLELIPNAIFQVVGMLPHSVLAAAISRASHAELHANVPDIRPYFWDARVYVVPMRFGGGVRQKIMEAWSMGVPVVATSMAVEGLTAQDGINCWVVDDPAAFSARVAGFLEVPAPPGVLRTAWELVQTNNSISVAAGCFESLIVRTAKAKRCRPYKALFDLRWMEIGAAGGIEQLTHELVSAISRLDKRNSYTLYCPRRTFSEWHFPEDFQVRGSFSDALSRQGEGTASLLANQLAASLSLHPVLTPEMRTLSTLHKLDFDLVHSPVGYIHPDLGAFPHVLTMLDLQHLHYPEFFSADDWKNREKLYRESAAQAKHIICISEFTRQDIHKRYGIPLERMTTIWVIPSGEIWRTISLRQHRRLLAGMGIEGRFLFFPAHCWPHKNHARLVEAFALARPELPSDIKLVFTGRSFPDDHLACRLIEDHDLRDRVIHLGYRSPIEVRALYASAHALVFPSLFEGFGMPIIEAMVAGCPVACGDNSSLPEIGGDAALYFDARDPCSIARALIEVSTDRSLRSRLRSMAKDRLPLFNSKLLTLNTLAIYQRVFDQL